MLTNQELQSLRNLGNEAEAAADEIVQLRAEEEGAKEAFWYLLERKLATDAECAKLRRLLESAYADIRRFTPLRAKGVVDADDNLDCWDAPPFTMVRAHAARLNEKDPSAMWRVVDLFARDLGPNVRAERAP